jgi:hypothetical protein
MTKHGRLVRKMLVHAPGSQSPRTRRPRVSVIIPCYNYGQFLPGSIESAVCQDGVEPEVIVVDDASTDGSADIANDLATKHSQVRLLRHSVNTGHVTAFNDGLACATGEFIVRLDADDLLTPGALARAAGLFGAFPAVGLVYGHPRHFTTEKPPVPRTNVRSWTVWSGGDWIAERCRRGVNCITTPEAVIRASVMDAVGGLDSRLRFAQDMEMWLRVAAVSDVGRVDGPDQALHRDHSASMSVTDGAGPIIDLQERRRVFEVLFDGPGGQLSDAATLHDRARQALAKEALETACHAFERGSPSISDIDFFIEFAESTYPRARELSQWRALERRSRVGARLAPLIPPFAASVVWRRVRNDYMYRRWEKVGV